MPSDPFHRLFWGFLFIFVDLKLCSLNILPDILGYVLVFLGLGVLRPVQPRFREAWVCAGVLIFFSLQDFVQTQPATFQDFGPISAMKSISVAGIIGSILQLILIWHICGGIRDLALDLGRRQLARIALARRNLYLALPLAPWLILLVGERQAELLPALAVALTVYAVVIMCLLMGLMRQAARQLPEIQPGPMAPATRDWTGLVLAMAACAFLVMLLFPNTLGIRMASFPFGPQSGMAGLNIASTQELSGGRLHHVQIQHAPDGRGSFYVLELAPPLPEINSGGGPGGGSTGHGRAYQYRTVQIDGRQEQHGLEFHYNKRAKTVSIREVSRGSSAPPSLTSHNKLPAGSEDPFDLLEGNLFVVRLDDHGEIQSLEQLQAHYRPAPGAPPALEAFQRMLAEDPDVQALRLSER